MRIPVGKPLAKKYRKSGTVKRGYRVLVNLDGNPAKADIDPEGDPAKTHGPYGVWKRVINKNRDLDKGVLVLKFSDDSVMIANDRGALYSDRLVDPEGKLTEKETE